MRKRTEKDFLGKVKVPADVYYGAETERARENFQISGIRTQKSFIRSYAILKRCAALANMKLGKLDARKGNAIVRACDDVIKGKLNDQFVLDVFQAGAGTSTNMNLNEVIANRAITLLGGRKGNYKIIHPNDDVNMSQSTNDTYHAAIHLAAYLETKKVLLPSLSVLERGLGRKAKAFSRVVKIGRTHLQDAVPITLGQEFSGYASSVAREAKNLGKVSESMLSMSLGGTAVGTGIEASKKYSKAVIAELNRYTHARFMLAKNFFDIQQNQNEELWLSGALRGTAVALNKIANDIRLLASGPEGGFADIYLPAVQPGSSIMPGKVNPSMPEMLNMACFAVLGSDATITNAAEGGQLELNVYMPIVAYELLFSIDVLANASAAFTKKCITGIKANKERLARNLERDMSIATALAPYIGYDKAALVAKKARKEKKSVKQVCLEARILPKKLLDKILDPKRLTKMR